MRPAYSIGPTRFEKHALNNILYNFYHRKKNDPGHQHTSTQTIIVILESTHTEGIISNDERRRYFLSYEYIEMQLTLGTNTRQRVVVEQNMINTDIMMNAASW